MLDRTLGPIYRTDYPAWRRWPRLLALVWLWLWGPELRRESYYMAPGWDRTVRRTGEALWDFTVATLISAILVGVGVLLW